MFLAFVGLVQGLVAPALFIIPLKRPVWCLGNIGDLGNDWLSHEFPTVTRNSILIMFEP